MNCVALIGRLDGDPLRRTVAGETVVRMRVRLDDPVGGHPTVVDVDVRGRQGAAVASYLTDGRRVGIVGRLASSVWRDGTRNRREHVFVAAASVEFLDRPPNRSTMR